MNWQSKFSIIMAVITLLLFIWIASSFVFSEGICCADDSSNAVLAKNFAWGYGYANSIDYLSANFSLRPFQGVMTSSVGPMLILPTSVAIWVFGNKYWVPGTTEIIIWLIILLAIYRALWVINPGRASTTLIIFLILVYIFSPLHFGHWYMLLGEVPQILLVILAVLIWSKNPHSKFCLPVASFFIGLSVLAKILSILYAITFLLCVALWYFQNDGSKRLGDAALRSLWATVWVFLPILCFEAWKLATLGPHRYAEESVEFFRFIKMQGVSADNASLLQRLTDRIQKFYESFGVSLLELLLAAGFSVFLSVRLGSPFMRRFAVVLFVGVIAHAGYWLIMSIGWPRYYYTGLVLLCFLISTPMLIFRTSKGRILYMLTISLLGIGTIGRVSFPPLAQLLWSATGSLHEPQAVVSQFLNNHMDRRLFVGSWGGAVADLEYLSNRVLNFKGWQALQPQDYERGFLLVSYDRFDYYAPHYQDFKILISRCGSPILSAPPYAVYDCKGLQSPKIP